MTREDENDGAVDVSACDGVRAGRSSGFGAAVAWAARQDFDDDHAERIRRQAWGDIPETVPNNRHRT